MKTLENKISDAIYALGFDHFQCKSSYPDSNTQANLLGRTYYASDSSLKFFKAKIQRGTHSANGFYFVMMESLPHPDYDMKRVKRIRVFNIFGRIVTDDGLIFTNGAKADKVFNELVQQYNQPEALEEMKQAISDRVGRDGKALDRAIEALA
jgi:hypothetical protein